MKKVARLIVVNARERNSESGTSGSLRLAMRIGNATSATAPAAMATQAAASCQSCSAPRMSPNDRPPTAMAATAEPSQSKRRAVGVARLRDVAQRHPQRESEHRDVDEERDPPADGVDQQPADQRPEQDQPGRGGRPDAERAAALGPVLEGLRDERQGAGHEEGAGRALEQPEDDQPLERRGEPAQRRGDREAREPDGVDPAPAVVVGQRAGEDQQGGEDREIAADDVGLALEDAEDRRRAVRGRCWAARRSRWCRPGTPTLTR